MNGSLRTTFCSLLLLSLQLLCTSNSAAYSVFTHEELIDLAWNGSIRPILLQRFPTATEEQLRVAHSYAYGGCAIQDMGYYPFGKAFFSNLAHYVRTGDFIAWMFRNAQTLDELAFAMGALSHYLGDSIGHSEAVNPATAVAFPKLKRKFGSIVTYGESPHAHIRTEFAFDIDELTNAQFAPPAYLEYIGFRVPRAFLARAFASTYGFELHELLGEAHPALRSYRSSVRRFIPLFAEGEVVLHSHRFPPQRDDDPVFQQFQKRVAQTSYERRWKHTYRGPGFKAHLMAILIFIVPKIGAASDLAIKIPTADTQDKYLRSVLHTESAFREALQKFAAQPDPQASLANIDLDTGYRMRRGEYELADIAYDQLLARITSQPERAVPADLKRDVLNFYSTPAKNSDPPKKIQAQLEVLKNMHVK
jgi:Zinc dependent phospholipase C